MSGKDYTFSAFVKDKYIEYRYVDLEKWHLYVLFQDLCVVTAMLLFHAMTSWSTEDLITWANSF